MPSDLEPGKPAPRQVWNLNSAFSAALAFCRLVRETPSKVRLAPSAAVNTELAPLCRPSASSVDQLAKSLVESEIVSKPYAVYIHGQAQIRHAVPMKLIATEGHFIGTGTEIIEVEETHAGN